MSVLVMNWVWNLAPTIDPTEQLVLLAIADNCDDDGRNAFPSVATIARKTRLSVRSVQRATARLRERGVLVVEPGDGRIASNRYEISVARFVVDDQATAVKSHRGGPVSPGHPYGDGPSPHPRHLDTGRDDAESPDPPREPSLNRQVNHNSHSLAERWPAFDEFWLAYPRKQAKQNALRAWIKLRPNSALIGRVMAALEAQKRSRQWQREGGIFIPHAATWINGRRWEDATDQAAPDAAAAAWKAYEDRLIQKGQS